jgi:hypothetical protein
MLLQGNISVNGDKIELNGYGPVAIVHQNMKAHRLANRWQMVKFFSGDTALVIHSFVTPKYYDKVDGC